MGSIDYIHPLTQTQRKERLIDGYIRSYRKLKKIVPNDIKSLLRLYIESMDKIKSKTEIKEAEEQAKRRKEFPQVNCIHLLDYAWTSAIAVYFVLL